jgi:catecholate siderophore receptor
MEESEITTTVGSYGYARVTGDFNIHTGADAGLRITAMTTQADNNGAGSSIDKKGLAVAYRFGIGTADEFSIGLYTLRNDNGMNYGIRWIKPTSAAATSTSTINEAIAPSTYYGMESDYNKGGADYLTASHTHRFQDGGELKSTVRKGQFTRDQRASAINYGAGTGINNFSDATVITRGNNNKIQDLNGTYAQSDYSTKFSALGVKHQLMVGTDLAQESKNVYAASALAAKPTTTVGNPDNGATINEAARILTVSSAFSADNLGLYAQDTVQIAEHWKVVGGLRFDRMRGNFDTLNTAGQITGSYAQTISDWSKRLGVLYQPTELSSYHFSYGTSFNTSADTYSYVGNTNAARIQAANTPPEQSSNIEVGAKLDSANKMFSTRLAVFQSTKYNERNTDPDSSATMMLLSGQRHTTGLEIDITGRITPQWEVFGSYMWMPDAMIDVSNATGNGARQGERPGLTPIHSGTVWSTYQVTPALRVGSGINFRGEQSPATNPGFMAPAYATLDLMTEYQLNERYVLKGNITNALNKLYADSLYTNFYVPGSGRNIQVTLTAKF